LVWTAADYFIVVLATVSSQVSFFFFFSPVDSYFDALSERENHDKLLIYSLVAPTLH
jgi:hypothetical protein